jgi:hypothetical protein
LAVPVATSIVASKMGAATIRGLRKGTADQAGVRRRIALAQRIAAGLIAVTVVRMVSAR